MSDSPFPLDVFSLVQIIWQESLEVSHVAPHDKFFQSGGTSLQAMQVMARVREQFSVEIPLACLFDSANLQAFAASVEQAIRDAADEEYPT